MRKSSSGIFVSFVFCLFFMSSGECAPYGWEVAAISANYSAYQCRPANSFTARKGIIDDDEFLYVSEDFHNFVKDNERNTTSADGELFECHSLGAGPKTSNYCSFDSVVLLGPGHVFLGRTVYSPQAYRCTDSFANNKWEAIALDKCEDSLENVDNTELVVQYINNRNTPVVVKWAAFLDGSYVSVPDSENICSKYMCIDGYTVENGKCVKSSVETSDNEKTKSENQTNKANNDSAEIIPVLGDACAKSDLPQYATSGVYVNNGVSIVCAATSCQSGTYLVVNSSGTIQGWCVASTYCKDGTKLNIINGTQTDLQCLSQDQNQEETAATTETESSEQQTVDNRSECERGIAGYVFFEGICMPEYQKNQIEQQRKAKELTGLKSSIDVYADKIAQIEAAHTGDKVTVWKNEEGKFNTSRLLSDSLAGVALGTVGGLVVNKVVKNNNIETGFDEIGCAIDGEKIANFDDTFVISGAVDKNGCVGNNYGYSNVYVWASRYGDGADYSRMVEDVANPDNNACWVRVDIESDNAKIQVSDIPSRWFMVGQQITCGNWTNRDVLRQRALDARKSARTWATVGGAVGGAGVGVGVMELFGNRLIGGKVMGQKALDEAELLYSQMSEGEREEYRNSSEQIEALCNELHAKGGTHAACGD